MAQSHYLPQQNNSQNLKQFCTIMSNKKRFIGVHCENNTMVNRLINLCLRRTRSTSYCQIGEKTYTVTKEKPKRVEWKCDDMLLTSFKYEIGRHNEEYK